ncbi:MAG: helix-turn-helix domain-containing protein [Chitinophagaceae bacterium]
MPAYHQIMYPSQVLNPYVRCYIELTMGAERSMANCLLPAKTEAGLFVNTGPAPAIVREGDDIGGDISGNPFVCKVRGAVSDASLRLHLDGVLSMFVILFHPAAFYQYFSLPAHVIAENYTPAAWVLGPQWEEMGLRVRDAPDFLQRVSIAESYLLSHFPERPLNSSILEVMKTPIRRPQTSVQDLARESFLSERQFRRQFLEQVGISPARYLSICRLNQVLEAKQSAPELSWRTLAFEYGYADSAHLLKDMKKLLGTQPSMLSEGNHFLNVQGTQFRLVAN